MALGDFWFKVDATLAPPGTSHLIGVAIVAVFHHVVDAHTHVAIVVIIGLPKCTVRVRSHFVVVAEVVRQYFEVAAVGIAAKHHPLTVRRSLVVDLVSTHVNHGFTVAIHNLLAVVAKIEVQFAICSLDERVDSVVGLFTA